MGDVTEDGRGKHLYIASTFLGELAQVHFFYQLFLGLFLLCHPEKKSNSLFKESVEILFLKFIRVRVTPRVGERLLLSNFPEIFKELSI